MGKQGDKRRNVRVQERMDYAQTVNLLHTSYLHGPAGRMAERQYPRLKEGKTSFNHKYGADRKGIQQSIRWSRCH